MPTPVITIFRTAIWLAEQLTDAKFEIEEESTGTVVIRCEGLGYAGQPTKPDAELDSVSDS